MVEKICSHCGATVLVGLQYCPGCLRSLRHRDDVRQAVAVAVAPDAHGTLLERIQGKWQDLASWLSLSVAPKPVGKDDPRFAYRGADAGSTTSMSDSYTRVVCPKCLRSHRAPLDQSPSALVMCNVCLHQFPASLAAEFRRGADLHCFHCGVTTFCVNGLKVNQCPNCKIDVELPRDPEKTKLLVLASVVAVLIFIGFAHAVATQTTSQFLLWLCVGGVFTFAGFVAMVALGF